MFRWADGHGNLSSGFNQHSCYFLSKLIMLPTLQLTGLGKKRLVCTNSIDSGVWWFDTRISGLAMSFFPDSLMDGFDANTSQPT